MSSARDPDRTRRLILDAAATEFCGAGPAGARIDAIAAAAGVNKRMLYHYFGSKDGLFAAVLADQLESALDAPACANLADRLAALQQYAVAHPQSIRLLMWEALTYGGEELESEASLISAWRDRIAGIQDGGRMGTTIDPGQLQLALAGLVLFPFAFPQLTRLLTGCAIADPKFIDARNRLLPAIAALFEPPVEAPAPPKPRYRLAARVTETSAGQPRRQTDSNALK